MEKWSNRVNLRDGRSVSNSEVSSVAMWPWLCNSTDYIEVRTPKSLPRLPFRSQLGTLWLTAVRLCKTTTPSQNTSIVLG